MSEWITDRAPVKEDCNGFRKVWTIISSGRVCMIEREFVEVGDPWMPIIPPDPPELMNESAKSQILAELNTVMQMIDSLPQSSVIDRMSLEARKLELERETEVLTDPPNNNKGNKQ